MTVDTQTVIYLVSLAVTLISNYKLIDYRIGELTKKVEKHNSVVERTYELEGKMEAAQDDIQEIKDKIK